MKKREVKTTLLLALPALALFGFASVLSLRHTKRDLRPPYTVTKHRLLIGNEFITDEQRGYSQYLIPKFNPNNYVFYEVEVTARNSSWLEKMLWGDTDSHAQLSNSSCTLIKSGKIVQARTGASIGGAGFSRIEAIYGLDDLKKANGVLEFSVPLSWTDNGRKCIRKLTKRVSSADLQQGIK